VQANKEGCIILNTENFIISSIANIQTVINFPFNEVAFQYWIRPNEKANPVKSNQWASSVILIFAVWEINFLIIQLIQLTNKKWKSLKLITNVKIMPVNKILMPFKSAWKFFRMIHNSKITILSSSWAKQVQKLANQFSAIEHDIKDGKYGDKTSDMQRIAEDIQRTNGATHGLWDEMEKELNLKK